MISLQRMSLILVPNIGLLSGSGHQLPAIENSRASSGRLVQWAC